MKNIYINLSPYEVSRYIECRGEAKSIIVHILRNWKLQQPAYEDILEEIPEDAIKQYLRKTETNGKGSSGETIGFPERTQSKQTLTAMKGTAFEQVLKELYKQSVRNAKEATEVLTEYYGVRLKKLSTSWCLGYTCIISALDVVPEYIPEPLKKGVKEYIGRLTVNRRTKVAQEFLAHWDTLDCAKGLSGESLKQFGIYTLDPDTHVYVYWAVGKDEDDLYYLEINEYAVRRLTDEAREMMTIEQ